MNESQNEASKGTEKPEESPQAPPAGEAASPEAIEEVHGPEADALKEKIVEAIRTVYDPEIPVNIYDMGMIYDVKIGVGDKAFVKMTLTSPACPVAGTLPGEVEQKVKAVPGVADAVVDLVWDPPWTPAQMSEAARLQLNM